MTHLLIGALRAIIETLGLCLLAQGVLYLLCGHQRARNPIYQLFALISAGPRRIVAIFLPHGAAPWTVAAVCLACLFSLWIGLALLRMYV